MQDNSDDDGALLAIQSIYIPNFTRLHELIHVKITILIYV